MSLQHTVEEEGMANPYTAPAPVSGAQQPTQGQPPRKLAGKYETEQELEQGHIHLQSTLTERNRQLEETQSQLREVLQVVQQMAVADRMSPADRANTRSSSEAALDAAGIPVEQLRQVIRQEAEQLARQSVKDELAPIIGNARARQTVEQDFPDVDEKDVARFLAANPELNRRYNDKLNTKGPEEAWDFAFTRFVIAQGGQTTADPAHQQALRDAGLPSGAAEMGRDTPGDPYQTELADSYDEYLNSGDKRRFLLKRLAHILPKAEG